MGNSNNLKPTGNQGFAQTLGVLQIFTNWEINPGFSVTAMRFHEITKTNADKETCLVAALI
jgi:hypothetical protein